MCQFRSPHCETSDWSGHFSKNSEHHFLLVKHKMCFLSLFHSVTSSWQPDWKHEVTICKLRDGFTNIEMYRSRKVEAKHLNFICWWWKNSDLPLRTIVCYLRWFKWVVFFKKWFGTFHIRHDRKHFSYRVSIRATNNGSVDQYFLIDAGFHSTSQSSWIVVRIFFSIWRFFFSLICIYWDGFSLQSEPEAPHSELSCIQSVCEMHKETTVFLCRKCSRQRFLSRRLWTW